MLVQLHVGNLALAEDVVVDLEPGLTMLTGETGAGKSLIAGALSLLTGGRTEKGLIREGEELAFVEGVCDLADRPAVRERVARLGVRLGEDGLLVLRRELRREGRGRVLVNGLVSSLALLEEIGSLLLRIQSQDQQRELVRPGFARDLLDEALELAPRRERVAAALEAWRSAERELAERRQEVEFARRQRDMWEYQARELNEAALDPDEAAALAETLALGRGARGLLEATAAARQDLAEGEVNAAALIGAALGRLSGAEAQSPRLAEALEMAAAAQDQVAEAARLLERVMDGVEVDPARLDELEARLALYQELQRKYDRDVPGLLALHEELDGLLARERSAASDLEELAAAHAAAEAELADACLDIRRRRLKGAGNVAARAAELIRPLALPKLELFFAVEPAVAEGGLMVDGEVCRVTRNGADRVTLRARTNPGEAPGDVARIASGGERSRIHLGLTVMGLEDRPDPPLQLFDEVDAGLGMDHAVAVAALLGRLARAGQVLCVTHLPTVAARGDRHLRVAKSVRDGRTSLTVGPVAGQERVAEIARLLGGAEAGDPARQQAYARELLRGPAARTGNG
ncbi:MAG: AAA family ATPase [bacterium]|nr:AAA family ATPase [bacterium]